MKTISEKELKIIVEFSVIFNIPQPKSNDFSGWWRQTVNNIDIWLLRLLRDNNVFGRYRDESKLKWMHDMVLQRIEELEIAI